jgi:tetratricopeptide (TPR) repeat protein
MLKRQSAEEIIDPKRENAPPNPMSAVVASPSLGKTPSPEAKPNMQNKPPPPGSAELMPKKTSQEFQPANLELAAAALEQQNFKTAIELLEAYRSRDAQSSLKAKELYSKALVGRAGQIMKKSPAEAEGMMRKAVEADPKNVRAYFNLGKIYTQTKEYALAIDAYRDAIALNPNFSDAFFNLGFIYATTGKYKEAERFFTQVVQLKPSYLDKALFNLALVQEKLGKKQESLANLQDAAAARPENQKVRAYLKHVESGVEESP